MQTIVAHLSDNDLERVRRSQAKLNALSNIPEVDLKTAEEAHYEHMLLTAELVERYEIDDSEDWSMSTFTGKISYED